jgi:hypothetical protein
LIPPWAALARKVAPPSQSRAAAAACSKKRRKKLTPGRNCKQNAVMNVEYMKGVDIVFVGAEILKKASFLHSEFKKFEKI